MMIVAHISFSSSSEGILLEVTEFSRSSYSFDNQIIVFSFSFFFWEELREGAYMLLCTCGGQRTACGPIHCVDLRDQIQGVRLRGNHLCPVASTILPA